MTSSHRSMDGPVVSIDKDGDEIGQPAKPPNHAPTMMATTPEKEEEVSSTRKDKNVSSRKEYVCFLFLLNTGERQYVEKKSHLLTKKKG